MKTQHLKTIGWLGLFAIAMGFLESAVVIYLRELYYPGGFDFPLQIIPPHIAKVELFREAATIIMLVGAGYMAGNTKLNRFACFLIAFAVWDLFYYLFLYLFIGWPQSLFTWDILFLIPFPWTGPVIAPCLVAIGMIVFGLGILLSEGQNTVVSRGQWFLLLGGCMVIILSFLYDYFSVTQANHFLPDETGLLTELRHYVPAKFNWPLYGAGLMLSASGVTLFLRRATSPSPNL